MAKKYTICALRDGERPDPGRRGHGAKRVAAIRSADQDGEREQSSGAETVQTVKEVTVTGSRITTPNGYKAPTPVTAVSTQELAKVAPESIPQALEQLPQFSATTGTNANNNQGGIPNAGNYLNLRGLARSRTSSC